MSRYNKNKILNNSNEYYRRLRQTRNNLKNIRQFETPILRHPTVSDRVNIDSTQIVYGVGDRLYKLADQYYNDVTLWWIIAWYNGRPTEADFFPGDLITIPLNIEQVIEAYGL